MNNDATAKERMHQNSPDDQARSGMAGTGVAAQTADGRASSIGALSLDGVQTIGVRAGVLAGQFVTGIDSARQKITDTRDLVVEKTKTAARATDNYVTNNPWKAVGIASGIGLVLGLMLRRR